MTEEADKQKIKRLEAEVQRLHKNYQDTWTSKTIAEGNASDWQNVAINLSTYLRKLGERR